jgi:hypothetical protein
VLGYGQVAGLGAVEVVEEEVGTSLAKTTTWMSGSSSSPRTISCNATTVSETTRFIGGFANVILAVRGS